MEYIKKYLINLILIFIILILIIIKIPIKAKENNIIESPEVVMESSPEISKIFVDIKGCVKKPGIYEVKENSRINDVIKLSGGLNKDADTSLINLSKIVTDQMVIIIYTKNEVKDMIKKDPLIKYVPKECNCPKITNDACNNESNDTNGLISLNKATIEELSTLPGIGTTKAQDIINYRNENDGFKSIDELKNVKGIGDATYENLKNLITI